MVGLLRGLGTGRGRGREPNWEGEMMLVLSGEMAIGGGVFGGVGVLGGDGSSGSPAVCSRALGWRGGVTWVGGSGGGWLGA